ncbi:hypothetical protein Pcac1_g9314 [Phytophthora cactorum]|uniref:Uncharacterized protein n=1 Tax=Phytophthora cactorum TaxID=29920 RepID=A0A8T0YU43_9STRA|nr:hypothetical protein Pcac1_g9314 [Phytophthora cactorum]KAG2817431.1 hypothetical protein PC112_g13054 [Phytophthora cactorum]KAG2851292.1 hypothetical protein PC113_g16043 [Phytophthora cactorum]KAG2898804.1 hypothetical protein PC114_g14135 [Phytophthora cactorum]KAG3029184.1 hypothetical protein PC120_g4428 [Phytophthora cactorum]
MLQQLSRAVLQTPRKAIQLSYWRFAVWWIIILSVHVVTCVFNALYAYGYWNLKGTYLNICLEFYHIGMPEPYHHTIAVIHGIVSAVHGTCILLMLGGSLRQNSLAFTPWSSSTVGDQLKTSRTTSSAVLQNVSRAYGNATYLCGLCGVNGKYFDAALICREIVETALQTAQAYRMSVLLPRTLLNRAYVILLAANCWTSIVADSVFFGRDEARRRFTCIVLDGMLDLMACMGVQLLVMANYVGDYNPSLYGFDETIWYDDEWVARALNEFRMVVVVSWSDLVSRTIFSLGLVITTTNCHKLGISGEKNDVEMMWSEFDASTVVQLLIRHCPGLEMPEILTKFSGLHGIKVYNTTIMQWGESAALTNSNHPIMASLYLARVNLTDGLLPIGLQSPDFPSSMNDIEICVTNLRLLPDDIATKWPQGGLIYVEYGQLTTVPLVLLRLKPVYLALTGNPITELPPELLEVPNLLYLGVSDLDLQELPRNVTQLSATLSRICIVNTNISFFWSWQDEFVERTGGKRSPIRAAGSPYCNDLENLKAGTADTFHLPLSPEFSQILMNSSQENRQVISKTVDCTLYNESLYYPLTYDDSINAISSLPPVKRR